jgi:hypothetical protein
MPSELREALTAAGASALIPKIIDPLLLEYMRRFSPLVRAIPMTKWDADVYYWNQRTQLATGGFTTDGGAVPVSTSTYVQQSFQIKHLQIVGAVTGYAQQVTRQVIGDLRQTEIEGAIQGLLWDIETACVWGNSASTLNGARPQFDGLDTQVSTFSGGSQNAQDKGGNSLTLAMLDELIDMVQINVAMPILGSSWMFVTSSTAESKISQLLTNQQRFNDKVEVAPGLMVDSYRNIPIVLSSFLAPRSFSMGTVTATGGTGALPGGLSGITGTLGNATYRYVIAPVVARQGEILPAAEASGSTGGTSGFVGLGFTVPTGADGASPILYKVYRTASGGASGSETFLGYVDATVGLAADGVTPVYANAIFDTGAALIPVVGSATTATTVPGTLSAYSQYWGTNTGMFPLAAGQENIYLMNRDRNYVIRPYVRECLPVDVYPTTSSPDTLPFALVDDTVLAVRGPKYLGRLARVTTSV